MLYREIIAVCSQIHTKHINTLCGQNVELLNVNLAVHIMTTGGTYSDHRGLKSLSRCLQVGYSRAITRVSITGPTQFCCKSRAEPWRSFRAAAGIAERVMVFVRYDLNTASFPCFCFLTQFV